VPVRLQPQRVALGTTDTGRPVYITIEWYRVLRQLVGDVSDVVDGDGNSNPDAIDLGNDDAAAVKVLAITLQRAVSALEADASVPALRAQVAALEARIAGMEQTP